MSAIKTIFIGTSDFALPALRALCRDTDFVVQAVITQPDMPAGRQQTLTPPPVKELAQTLQISTIWQPQKIIQVLDNIRELQPDLIVVAAYAQIIPPEILRQPKHGCLNIHGSLLPKYRGAAVIQAPILNNDAETGVTIMLMDEHLDTGPLLRQASISLPQDITAGQLFEQLAELGGKLLIPTIKDYLQGQLKPQGQDNSRASYVKRLTKADGLIDWQQPAWQLERFVRAMTPWPGAWTWFKGKQLKVLQVQAKPIPIDVHKPGKVFIYNNGLAVQCAEQALIIEQLQLEGKNALLSKDFLNGNQDFVGSLLG